MQGDIVAQGIELMLYGMGTVVLFLALLVVTTTLMSRLVGRYFPEPEPQSSAAAAIQKLRGKAPASSVDDTDLVAVISAAMHQHRVKNKK